MTMVRVVNDAARPELPLTSRRAIRVSASGVSVFAFFVVLVSQALSPFSSASGQTLGRVQLRTPACGTPWSDFDSLAQVLRVELRGVGTNLDVVSEVGDMGSLSIEVADCTDLGHIVLRATRGQKAESQVVDLRDAGGSAGVRTLALLLSDLWNEAGQPAVVEPEPTVAERVPASPISEFALAAGVAGVLFDAPSFAPGAALGLDWRHGAFSLGLFGLFHHTGGVDVLGRVDLFVTTFALRTGVSARTGNYRLGAFAELGAGVIAARAQAAEPGIVAGSDTQSSLRIGLLVSAEWAPQSSRWGLRLEAGASQAFVTYEGLANDAGASRSVASWAGWGFPMRLLLVVRL